MGKAGTIEKHYRVAEVASMIGLAPATIRKKILRREIGYHKQNRAIMIPESEIKKLLGDYHAPVTAA